MNSFKLYKNKSRTNSNYNYLIDVQSPILSGLKTRLVIPLMKKPDINTLIKNLNPEITINNISYIALTQQMAAVSENYLGELIRDVQIDRTAILSSIDFLITGF